MKKRCGMINSGGTQNFEHRDFRDGTEESNG